MKRRCDSDRAYVAHEAFALLAFRHVSRITPEGLRARKRTRRKSPAWGSPFSTHARPNAKRRESFAIGALTHPICVKHETRRLHAHATHP